MSVRAAALVIPLALLAGCATTPRTTYHYDGQGDYYTGATPGADIVVTSPGYAGWGHPGYGGWGYGGYGLGGGYYGSPWSGWYGGGYGYGYSPWWGWRGAHHHSPPKPQHPRISRRDRTDRWDSPPRRLGDADDAPPTALRGAPLSLPASAAYAPDRTRGARLLSPPPSQPAFGDSRAVAPRAMTTPSAPVRANPPPMRSAPPPMLAPQPSFERSAPPPSRASSKRE